MKGRISVDKQLTKTDTVWYRICSFFRKFFVKEKPVSYEIREVKQEKSLFEEENKKRNLAEKLLSEEIEVTDLTDDEVEDMTVYFKKDIEEVDRELEKVKANILRMQKILENKKTAVG